MFDGINVQDRDILRIPSSRRNPIIADVFSRLNLMERRGSGFKKIIEDYQSQYRYSDVLAPVFQSEYNAFFLTLKNLNYHLNSHSGERKGERKGERNETEEKMLLLMRDNPQITMADLSELTGLSKRQVERSIGKLKSFGILTREGSTKSGKWIVIDNG